MPLWDTTRDENPVGVQGRSMLRPNLRPNKRLFSEGEMTEFIQVFTTTENKRDAQDIARALVEQRLAGCVQIVGPIASTYHWQGQIETASEWLCIIKSRQELYPALEQAILQAHPYEVPEILATPVVAGGQSYLEWLGGELRVQD